MESVRELYKKFYSNIQFDRSLLFKTIALNYSCTTVLYPGSSIHITPSFYFPHVVYIDKSPLAAAFFSREEEVKELIKGNKHYSRSAYFQFIKEDFTKNLNLREKNYDLLISFYSGDIPSSCKRLLKRGGYLLTNNYSLALPALLSGSEFSLQAVFVYKSQGYQVINKNLDQYKTNIRKKPVKSKAHHQIGLQYIKNELSYLFIKR